MDLKQLLSMLEGVSGPNGSGEYTAKCPAHQDRTASLTVTVKPSPRSCVFVHSLASMILSRQERK